MALQRSSVRVSPHGRFLACFALLAALALPACSVAPRAPDPVQAIPAVGGDARTQAVFTAIQMVGAPYRWGGSTPDGFDCSGLVQYVFSSAGLRLPRTADAQQKAAVPVPLDDAVAGDLLFFRDGGRTSHVAIYLGDGRFVHAPSTGKQVSLDSFGNSYWRARFDRAGRVAAPG